MICSLKNFTFKFSGIFYNIKTFKQNDFFNGLSIKNTYENVYEFLGVLEYIIKKHGYFFVFDEGMHKKQIVELYRKGYNVYSILDVKFLIMNYSEVLYLKKEEAEKCILSKMDNIKWLNKSEKKKYEVNEKDISSVYKNR